MTEEIMKQYVLNIFSENKENLEDFLQKFYHESFVLNNLKFEREFDNPIDMTEIVSTLIDNNEKYPAGIWISIDKNIFVNVTELNLDKIIRYLFERYPN